MNTSETVSDPGLYVSECCGAEWAFDEGDTFTRCPNCHALCVWEYESEVTTIEEPENPENEDGYAA